VPVDYRVEHGPDLSTFSSNHSTLSAVIDERRLTLMPEAIRILMLDVHEPDAQRIQQSLNRGDIDFKLIQPDTTSSLESCLDAAKSDLVIIGRAAAGVISVSRMHEIRNHNKTIPVIEISPHVSDPEGFDECGCGDMDSIDKISIENLPASIRAALNKNQKSLTLQNDQERYRLIFQSSLDGIWDWDAENDKLYFSSRWKSQLGYADDELENLFEVWIDLIHPEDQERIQLALQSFLQSSQSIWDQEFRLRHRKGHFIWMNARGSAIRNDSGDIIRVLGVHIDIEQRKQAEANAIKQQLLLDSVFQAVPDLFFLIDTDGTIRDYRGSRTEALPLIPGTLLGKNIKDLLPALIADQLTQNIQNTLLNKKLFTMEYSLDIQGETKHYEARINQLPDEGQVIIVLRDITQKNEIQTALAKRLKEMRCLFDVLNDMQEGVKEETLSQRLILHLVTAMQFPQITVPVIELHDRTYAHESYSSNLSHQLKAPVLIDDTVIGHVKVFYSEHREFLLPEEQTLIDTLAELLGKWLGYQETGIELSIIEERYRLINDLIPGGIYIVRAHDLYREYVSDGAFALLGVDDLVDVNDRSNCWLDLILPEDRDRVYLSLQQSINSKDANYEFEYRIRYAGSDAVVWISDRAYIERDQNGCATRFFGLLMDITTSKGRERELQERDNQLKLYERIVSTTHELMAFVDTSYTFQIVNEAYARTYNKPTDQINGHKVSSLIGEEVFEKMSRPNLDRCFNGEIASFQGWVAIGPGLKYLDITYHPYHDNNNEVIGSVVTSRDMTTIMNAQKKIRQAAQVFRSTIEGVTMADLDANIVDVNQAFTDITGYARDEVIGKNPSILQSGLHDEEFYEQLWSQLLKEGYWRGEVWNRRKDGSLYPQLLNISTVTDDKGFATGYVGVFSDMTATKKTEKRLEFLAHHDPLTSLPNRLLLNTSLGQSIKYAKRSGQQLGILFVDLDRFKHVNDTLGHEVGDLTLKQVSQRLSACIGQDDTLARISGDEFVIVLEKLGSVEECSLMVQKVMQAFETPFNLNQENIHLTCTIGVSIYPHDGDSCEILLRNADTARHRAKENSRNSYQFYTPEMTTSVLEHLFIENALRAALQNEEFQLLYQPQVNMNTQKIIGLEALIRWNHPQQGRISPAMFIPIAEQNGFIREIGDWVLKTACQQARQWLDKGVDFGRVSVNISGAQIQQEHFAERVIATLEECRLEPRYIELEVTETFVMKHLMEGIEQLKRLNDLGISVSIDDFGTGYSSLSYLKSLPVNKLKIDQSFIRDIPDDQDDVAISEAIIALGRALKLRVIAEGVETQRQVEVLIDKGCDEAQGFFYSKPRSVDSLEQILNNKTL
jgi:diguanylate cyclase (GGDEF)-like protein/PAS domain S-box-containing protein